MVNGYELDFPEIENRIGYEAHPASYTRSTESFQGQLAGAWYRTHIPSRTEDAIVSDLYLCNPSVPV